jgi:hypothetical protein
MHAQTDAQINEDAQTHTPQPDDTDTDTQPAHAGVPSEWLESALQGLEEEDAVAREAAHLALQAFTLTTRGNRRLIERLLTRIYHHHLPQGPSQCATRYSS